MGEEERLTVKELSGVGKKTLKEWKEKGVPIYLDEFVDIPPEELARVLGINITKVRNYITEAERILADETVVLKTARQILKEEEKSVNKINTGSKKLDEILGGGVPTKSIVLFGGPPGTGKTQFCEQLCVNNILDNKRVSVYIDTEGTFRSSRVVQMALMGRDESIDLDKLIVISPEYVQTPQKLYGAYVTVENELLKKGVDVGLLVIDSFAAIFRRTYVGRGALGAEGRGGEYARHFGKLIPMSRKYNMAIVMTAQVYGIPDPMAQGIARRKTGLDNKIYGGEYFLHTSQYCIALEQISGGRSPEDGSPSTKSVWMANLFKAPDKPKRMCKFILDERGVRDA